MAITEINSLVRVKDEDGNEYLVYPITSAENVTYDNTQSELSAEDIQSAVDEMAGKVNDAVPVYVAITMSASNWNANTKKYSFEQNYPIASYDIEIQPSDTCTTEQIEAWCEAQLVGSLTENTVKAYGDVPAVDIPIIVKAVKKND